MKKSSGVLQPLFFSVGTDGGKDARFTGKANKYPSESKQWEGKIIIQAKHTQRPNASCSDSDFQTIIKKSNYSCY